MTDTLESLREEIRWLRSELGQVQDLQLISELHRQYGLPIGAARVLEALHRAKGRVVDKSRLLDMIGSDGSHKVIEVRVCQARRVLGPQAVETVWHCGVRLGDVGRLAIESALESVARAGVAA